MNKTDLPYQKKEGKKPKTWDHVPYFVNADSIPIYTIQDQEQ